MKKIIASVGLFVFPFAAQAVPSTIPGKKLSISDLEKLLGTIINYFMLFGSIAAIIFIIIGGIQYMLAGGDDEKAGKARKRILNGVIGLAIILAAGVIVKTVVAILAPTTGTNPNL